MTLKWLAVAIAAGVMIAVGMVAANIEAFTEPVPTTITECTR